MSLLFWLSTLVPGFAVLVALSPHGVRRGVLGTLAGSFVLTLAAITPLVVVAHLFHLTTPTVAILYLGLVIGCLLAIARFRYRRGLRRIAGNTPWTILALVVVVIAIGAQLGGAAVYDTWVYAAKIRYLRDVGFSLQDPYSPLPVLESRYLVNTYFGIQAVGSWLTGIEPLEMFVGSGWFVRLLGLGGIDLLARAVFPSGWIASISVLGALFFIGAENAAAHPKYVAAYVLLPTLLAHLVYALERQTTARYLHIGATSLSMAVVHVGMWTITTLCLMPSLLGWYALRYRLGRSGTPPAIAATALVLPGAPFLLMTALQPTPNWAEWDSWFMFSLYTFRLGESSTLYMLNPGPHFWMVPTLAVLVLLLLPSAPLRWSARIRIVFVASTLLTVGLCMFNPLVLTVLMRQIPYWIVERAQYIAEVIAFVAIPAWVALIARDSLRMKAARVVFVLTVMSAGMFLFKPRIASFYNDRDKHRYMLQLARQIQELVQPYTHDRPVIAADATLSLMLPAVQVSAVMAPYLTHSNPADAGAIQRFEHARELLAPETSEERRRAITSRYDIKFALIGPHRGRGADQRELDPSTLHQFDDLVAERHGFKLFRLDR